jgi:hypothetical protein
LKNIWNAYREISVKIIEVLSPVSNYGIVPSLNAPERGLYVNNMFAGWDTIDNFILPKGMHEIHTGSYFRAGTLMHGFERPLFLVTEEDEPNFFEKLFKKDKKKEEPIIVLPKKTGADTFYVLLDTMDRMFADREGEYVWNFLNKE